ncbi:MAG: tetratricopeptide repeat protein [bacterium]|nr:tetratricopeptide repeat protein [bacterium]
MKGKRTKRRSSKAAKKADRRRTPKAHPSPGAPPPEEAAPAGSTTERSAQAPSTRRTTALGVAVLLVLTFLAYSPVWRAGFIWDDDDYVTENPVLRTAEGLRDLWLDPSATPQYYPLVHTSFWLEYRLWGLDASGYHLVNVLLHALGALLLWRVLRRLEIPGAYLAAAVFALHPVQVESVAWITERKNVLSGVFFLLSLVAFLRFRPLAAASSEAGGGPRRAYVLSLLFFLCALLSKTITASLPAVILLLAWWKQARLRRATVLPLVPMFVLGAALAAVTVYLEKIQVGARGEDWTLSVVERCLVAGRALWFYAGKLVWPHPLSFNYPRWTIDPGAVWQYLFPVAAVAVAACLLGWRRRLGKGPATAVLVFAGMLVPALGFFDVYPMRFSFVADHFQYQASIALIALGSAVAAAFLAPLTSRRRWIGPLAGGLLVIALGLVTWNRSHVYRDQETLWRDTLAKNPDAWLAHNNLGMILYERGEMKDAGSHFRDAVRLNPEYAVAHNNLGNVLTHQQNHQEATRHFEEAVRINPEHARAQNNLGYARLREGRTGEAIRHFQKALEVAPDYPMPHRNLGEIYRQQTLYGKALEHLEAAVRIEPGDTLSLMRSSIVLQALGRYDDAVVKLRTILRIEPDNATALDRLARLLAVAPRAELRDGEEAVALAEKACRLTGFQIGAMLDTLAAAYAEVGRFEDAVAAAQRAVEQATAMGRPQVARFFEAHAQLFQNRQPLRMSPP